MEEVVVATEPAGGGKKKVVVAIDETEHSYYALMWILDDLKGSISKFPLIIFMAQPPIKSYFTFAAPFGYARLYSSALTTQDFINFAQDKRRKLTLALLGKTKDICASRGVKAEIVTEVGDPKTAICSTIHKLNINLLTLGERGLGKIKRALIGSVSNYCIQNVKCPVLVVKKPQGTRVEANTCSSEDTIKSGCQSNSTLS